MEHTQPQPETPEESRAHKLEKQLPGYLKTKSRPLNDIARRVGMSIYELLDRYDVEGLENVPDGPFIVASNHTGNEALPLLAAFKDRNLHAVVGEKLVWQPSRPIRWLQQLYGVIPIKESLSNIPEDEEAALLARIKNPAERDRYESVLQDKGTSQGINGFKNVVGTLLQGDPVLLFPEGPFTHEGPVLRKAYDGITAIARVYEKMKGSKLPVLPVATDLAGKKIKIGKPVTYDGADETRFCDQVMKLIAEKLPEEARGFYKKP